MTTSLYIAWTARQGALAALRAAGIPLAGHSTALSAMTPTIAAALAALPETVLPERDRAAAAADPLRWAAAVLEDAGLAPASAAAVDPVVREALQQARQALQLLRAGRRDGATMGRCSSALDAVDAALARVDG